MIHMPNRFAGEAVKAGNDLIEPAYSAFGGVVAAAAIALCGAGYVAVCVPRVAHLDLHPAVFRCPLLALQE